MFKIRICIILLVIHMKYLQNGVQSLSEHMEEYQRIVLKNHFVRNLVEDYKEFRPEDEYIDELDEKIQTFREIVDKTYKITRTKRDVSTETSKIISTEMGVHIFRGFIENISIPVDFPIDLCLFKVKEVIFAAALHYDVKAISNKTMRLTIFKQDDGIFVNHYEYNESLSASALDCISTVYDFAFVAVTTIVKENNQLEAVIQGQGSPLFQITENFEVKIVQMFTASNLFSIHLWSYGNDIYLAQTFQNLKKPQTVNSKCPIYKWSGYNFDIIDELLCYNAVRLERFTIFQNLFIVVANHMDTNGTTTTFSYIYKYDPHSAKFVIFQKILTNAIVDIKYFYFDIDHIREHFLIAGNLYEIDEKGNRLENSHTIIYKYINNFFVPFQTLQLNHVRKILPVKGLKGEFILLISYEGYETQIYQYDGWKFTESSVDFTGGVFGLGVSNMRTYTNIINDTTLIVISNKDYYGEAINIFVPKYEFRNDLNLFYKDILKLSDRNINQISQYNISELLEQIQNKVTINDDVITINGNIELYNSVIQKVDTASVYASTFNLNNEVLDNINQIQIESQQLLQKYESIRDELNRVMYSESQIRVNDIEEEVELVKNDFDIIELDKLIVDETLNCNFSNDHLVSDLMHSNDDYTELYLDVNSDVTVEKDFAVMSIDNIIFSDNHVFIHGKDQILAGDLEGDAIEVDNLETPNIPILGRTGSIYTTENINEINVANLTILGLLNSIYFESLNDHILKHNKMEQNLSANLVINTLKTRQLRTNGFPISGQNFDGLISINQLSGSVQEEIVVNQDIQFVEPLYVNELIVTERINNLNIRSDGQLNVLLIRSPDTQVITGEKTFDNVTLLGSIFLQGKIKSHSLDKMNPIRTSLSDTVVDGDVEITGDVFVKQLLQGTNIFGRSSTYNVKELFENGLRLDEIELDMIDFHFQNVIHINNLITDRINSNINPNDFVTCNTDEVQYISGYKIFTNNLSVWNGFCEAGIMNKINVTELNSSIMKKSGDQVIDGEIQFERIVAKNIKSKNTVRGDNTPLQDILTYDTEQTITSNVTIHGNISCTDNIEIIELRTVDTSDKVCGYDINFLITDTLVQNDKEIIVTGGKHFRNCTFGSIEVDEQTFIINDFNLNVLNGTYASLEDEIIISDSVEFTSDMNISNISFNYSINNIPKEEFGKNWLLYELHQTFTAAQKFEHLEAANPVTLEGTFNNIRVLDILHGAYFIDRNENIDDVIFTSGITCLKPIILKGKINGIDIANEVLLKETQTYQELDELRIESDLNITGEVLINGQLNGLYYLGIMEFISNHEIDKIQVQGSASFHRDPDIIRLNNVNLNEISSNIWFTDMPARLTGSITLRNTRFENHLFFSNKLNDYNIEDIAKNYLSLSVSQEVMGFLEFTNDVVFEGMLNVETIFVAGSIKGLKSQYNHGVPIEYFNNFVLKRDIYQVISGHWTLSQADITDELHTILINGLDFTTDLMRRDVISNAITGRKQFLNLNVGNIYCAREPCIIQDIDVQEWISNSVDANGEHTINGITRINSPIFYNNIPVFGLVNNITFGTNRLLTKSDDQRIEGNVMLRTVSTDYKYIMTSIFQTLQVREINLVPVDHIFDVVVNNAELAHITINTSLVFNEILEVENLNLNNYKIFGIDLTQVNKEMNYSNRATTYEKKLGFLKYVTNDIVQSYKNQPYFLTNYDIRQIITGYYKRSVFLSISEDYNFLVTLTAGYSNYSGMLVFWKFEAFENEFIIDNFVLPGLDIANIVDIEKISFDNDSFLVVETFDPANQYYMQDIFGYHNNAFYKIYRFQSDVSRRIIAIQINYLNCIGVYSINLDDMLIKCLNINNDSSVFYDVQDLQTNSIRQAMANGVISGKKNHVLIGKNNDAIEIWENSFENFNNLILKQTININNPLCIDGIYYQDYYYMAVCSDKIENTVHYGTVEIFRSKLYGDYDHFQTISIRIPTQMKFSILPSKDLIFYTLTNNPIKPFNIYIYSGPGGFREYLISSILPRGYNFEILQLHGKKKEMIAITADNEIVIVEALMNR